MLKIIGTEANSVARKLKIPKGELIRFSNEKAEDMLDVAYYENASDFSLTVLTEKGENTVEVRKEPDEPLGLIFDDDSYLVSRPCRNRCIFCFVDQLPKGMRKSLYVKDDDWRMSFACGNYITLTNLSEKDIERIIKRKYSPLYISVHATDENLRRFMLGNPRAGDVMPLLRKFAEKGITMHTQIVLCPEINDGENLDKTLADLFSLYPAVKSVAVVPVGLTKFRGELYKLRSFTAEEAKKVVLQIEKFNEQTLKKGNDAFVFCSDEFYIKAGLAVPKADEYGDFDQIENGVGIVAQTASLFNQALESASSAKKKSFTVLCGMSALPYINGLIGTAKKKFPDLKAEAVAIKNEFFGETITVSGLITGGDIINQLGGRPLGDVVLIPQVMLREFQDVFLDGVTLKELQKKLKRKIIKISDGYELAQAVLNGEYL